MILDLVLLTLLLPRNASTFKISHQEMIKGVRIGGIGSTLKFYDTLEIPIIENTADEEDLTYGMAQVSKLNFFLVILQFIIHECGNGNN